MSNFSWDENSGYILRGIQHDGVDDKWETPYIQEIPNAITEFTYEIPEINTIATPLISRKGGIQTIILHTGRLFLYGLLGNLTGIYTNRSYSGVIDKKIFYAN